MGIIATLLPDPACLARVVQAARGRHEVLPCESWRDLISACDNEAVHLAVVDLFADGRANFDQVRSLKSRFARVTLVAYVVPSAGNSRDLFDAGRLAERIGSEHVPGGGSVNLRVEPVIRAASWPLCPDFRENLRTSSAL